MYMNTTECSAYHLLHSIVRRRHQSKRPGIRICGVYRRRLSKQAKEKGRQGTSKSEMEIKNMKLYLKNQSIFEENEKLRKKALLLHQENSLLLSQLQTPIFPQYNSNNNKP